MACFGSFARSQGLAGRAHGLVKERTRLRNRGQTQGNRVLKRQTKTRLALVERQIKELDAEIAKRIAEDEAMARKREILRSIPGLGQVAAAAILTSALRFAAPDGCPRHPVRTALIRARQWGENRSAASPVWPRTPASQGSGKASHSSAAGENPCAMRSTCPLSWPCGSTPTSRPSTLRFAMLETRQGRHRRIRRENSAPRCFLPLLIAQAPRNRQRARQGRPSLGRKSPLVKTDTQSMRQVPGVARAFEEISATALRDVPGVLHGRGLKHLIRRPVELIG